MKLLHQLTPLILSVVIAVSCTACGPDDTTPSSRQGLAQHTSGTPVELHILAAASLSDAMKQLKITYEAVHPDVKLIESFASSGTLQQQIEQGAPADLFLSAGEKQMQDVEAQQLIDTPNESNLLSNELVLIVPKGSTTVKSLTDLTKASVRKIALGEPQTVPAGTYAKESLTYTGIWNAVQAKRVYGKDVRQVLTYVETGNVDAGLVYKTDAATSKQITIAATVDAKSHTPILYPYGVVKNSQHLQQARDFYNWLHSPEALGVFESYGFSSAYPAATS